MPADQLVAFLLFAVVAAGTPGPSNVLLTALGANFGLRRGLPALFGVVGGMGLMLFVVAFGLGGLLLEHPQARVLLRWAGAAVLLWLAWKIASARQGPEGVEARPVGVFAAAALQWVNPKAWLVTASAAGTFLVGDSAGALSGAGTLAGLFMLAAAPCCLAWLSFGAVLQRWLNNATRMKVFNLAMGAVLALSVVLILA